MNVDDPATALAVLACLVFAPGVLAGVAVMWLPVRWCWRLGAILVLAAAVVAALLGRRADSDLGATGVLLGAATVALLAGAFALLAISLASALAGGRARDG